MTNLLDPMVPRSFRVGKRWRETHDTFSVELEPAGGGNDVAFAAGQFAMLYVIGVGEVPISISGDPAKSVPLVHTIRAVVPVTRALEKLAAGDTVGLRGPFGSAWPLAAATGNDVLLIAGGIGLAVLYQLLDRRQDFGRIILLYGARTPEDLLFPTAAMARPF